MRLILLTLFARLIDPYGWKSIGNINKTVCSSMRCIIEAAVQEGLETAEKGI